MPAPAKFENVSVACKANVYFDGKVVSHSVHFPDGSRKSLGVILPGSYSFNTAGPETMEITAGACRVRLAGETEWKPYAGGGAFHVAANAGFEIAVEAGGVCEYICSFG
ncbi:MAG: pyrimidine/purine nucleoside phosphorylase [Lentisphaeria bacterium]|jgi:hypothetical protein